MPHLSREKLSGVVRKKSFTIQGQQRRSPWLFQDILRSHIKLKKQKQKNNNTKVNDFQHSPFFFLFEGHRELTSSNVQQSYDDITAGLGIFWYLNIVQPLFFFNIIHCQLSKHRVIINKFFHCWQIIISNWIVNKIMKIIHEAINHFWYYSVRGHFEWTDDATYKMPFVIN